MMLHRTFLGLFCLASALPPLLSVGGTCAVAANAGSPVAPGSLPVGSGLPNENAGAVLSPSTPYRPRRRHFRHYRHYGPINNQPNAVAGLNMFNLNTALSYYGLRKKVLGISPIDLIVFFMFYASVYTLYSLITGLLDRLADRGKTHASKLAEHPERALHVETKKHRQHRKTQISEKNEKEREHGKKKQRHRHKRHHGDHTKSHGHPAPLASRDDPAAIMYLRQWREIADRERKVQRQEQALEKERQYILRLEKATAIERARIAKLHADPDDDLTVEDEGSEEPASPSTHTITAPGNSRVHPARGRASLSRNMVMPLSHSDQPRHRYSHSHGKRPNAKKIHQVHPTAGDKQRPWMVNKVYKGPRHKPASRPKLKLTEQEEADREIENLIQSLSQASSSASDSIYR